MNCEGSPGKLKLSFLNNFWLLIGKTTSALTDGQQSAAIFEDCSSSKLSLWFRLIILIELMWIDIIFSGQTTFERQVLMRLQALKEGQDRLYDLLVELRSATQKGQKQEIDDGSTIVQCKTMEELNNFCAQIKSKRRLVSCSFYVCLLFPIFGDIN